MIEDFVNKNPDDTNSKYFNEINHIGLDEEGGETKVIGNEDLIHRDITENEPETNWDSLKNVIEELADNQYDKVNLKPTKNKN